MDVFFGGAQISDFLVIDELITASSLRSEMNACRLYLGTWAE